VVAQAQPSVVGTGEIDGRLGLTGPPPVHPPPAHDSRHLLGGHHSLGQGDEAIRGGAVTCPHPGVAQPGAAVPPHGEREWPRDDLDPQTAAAQDVHIGAPIRGQ
jgi:hypothetical protein